MAPVQTEGTQGTMTKLEELKQQAREFRIPPFTPPFAHPEWHPATVEADKSTTDWALYHFQALAGSKHFQKILKEEAAKLLGGGFYSTGPAWGLEFGMEFLFLLFVLDDDVLHRVEKARSCGDLSHAGVAQVFQELLLVMMTTFPDDKVLGEALEKYLTINHDGELKRDRIDVFLAQAKKYPGTVVYSDELGEGSPITAAFRNIWIRATSVMTQDWSLRLAHVVQRDMWAMFQEGKDRSLGLIPSISDFIEQRRAYGCAESSLIVGELAEGIRVNSTIYYSPPVQSMILATNDIACWHNDIMSFAKELLNEEVNIVILVSKKEGCSYNKAAEIVNEMLVDRCKDLQLAAEELRRPDTQQELSLDSENAEKYITLCTNFICATFDFHARSCRFSA